MGSPKRTAMQQAREQPVKIKAGGQREKKLSKNQHIKG